MIGGFILTGSASKTVMIRGVGPSLAQHGVPGALANPIVTLHDSTGGVIASGTPWQPQWPESGLAPTDAREPVIRATLAPGHYTVVTSGAEAQHGVGLFELYDLTPEAGRLAAISTRGKVEIGDDIMIAGFILGGAQPSSVVVRAIGPSLTQHGVPGALSDPTLELYNASGSLVLSNDNWRTDQEQQLIASTVPPTDEREAAIVASLPPGNYTAVVRGKHNTTGVALVEVYDITP